MGAPIIKNEFETNNKIIIKKRKEKIKINKYK